MKVLTQYNTFIPFLHVLSPFAAPPRLLFLNSLFTKSAVGFGRSRCPMRCTQRRIGRCIVAAGEFENNRNSHNFVLHQEDVQYLLKLGVACVAGAVAIKYGSILMPELTRPNMINALVLVVLPVFTSAMALILASIDKLRP